MQAINKADTLAIDEIEENELSGLAQLIRGRYEDAESARNDTFFAGKSINEWLTECYDRYTSNHDNHRFSLVRIKTDVVHAKVKDMSVGSIDAPFVIKPTDIPELSKEQTESIQLNLQDALAEKLIQEGIVEVDPVTGEVKPIFSAVMESGNRLQPDVKEWLREQARLQKKSQQYEAGLIAGDASRNATVYMLDQMHEGKWKSANLDADFDDFLYGTGCIKEEVKEVKSLKWQGGKLEETTEERVVWRHVPIHNCYPSPDSEDAQNGTYFIESAPMRKQDLYACINIDWFDKDELLRALLETEDNVEWLSNDSPEQGTGWGDDRLVNVLIHQGTVSGSTLNDFYGYGSDDSDYLEPYDFYDIEAYVLSDIVIGCRMLNHPYGTRSYYSSNYKTAGKTFWGIGIAMLLAYREDRLNQYEKDITENLDKTIAPPIFYNSAMFAEQSHVSEALKGRNKLAPFNPDPSLQNGVPQTPYWQVRFESKTAELSNMFSRDYRLADDESGIPSLLSGNSDLRGGESTFRGMKLLASTSNIIIKSYFHNKDETRIVPAMRNLWYYNMLNSTDDSIKGDSKVVTRGTAGLMAQEIANAERMEAMPVIMQLLQASRLDDDKKAGIVDYLLKETMITGGIPAGQLMADPAVKAEMAQTVEQAQQGLPSSANPASPPQQTIKPATPMPVIGADTNLGGLT